MAARVERKTPSAQESIRDFQKESESGLPYWGDLQDWDWWVFDEPLNLHNSYFPSKLEI